MEQRDHKNPREGQIGAASAALPEADVYYLRIPGGTGWTPTGYGPRDAEIASLENPQVRLEKSWVWRLLAFGMSSSFGEDLRALAPEKNAAGKWTCSGYGFSLSHSGPAMAAVVSRCPVGVDVELCSRKLEDRLVRRIMTKKEWERWQQCPETERNRYALACWTGKESLFKLGNGACFEPQRFDTEIHRPQLSCRLLSVDGIDVVLSAALPEPGLVRWIPVQIKADLLTL